MKPEDCKKNLCTKFETVLAQDSTEVEDSKSLFMLPEETKERLARQESYKTQSSDDEELTDDEAYLLRHSKEEAEEVKRYNIGLMKNSNGQKNTHIEVKIDSTQSVSNQSNANSAVISTNASPKNGILKKRKRPSHLDELLSQ